MESVPKDRDTYTNLAKLAESTERYKDMAEYMKRLVTEVLPGESPPTLTEEERNLLSVAYKNIVGTRRSGWRILQSDHKEEKPETAKVRATYRTQIEKELNDICDEAIDLLENLIKEDSNNPESKIFFLKMRGDYYRYKVEVADGDENAKDTREELASQSEKAYEAAQDTAKEHLHSFHPIRLGLALNFSVFHYEIKNDPGEACSLARKAFDDAINDIDNDKGDEKYKDSALIMQLLRDNLQLWESAQDQQQEQEQAD